VKQDPHWWWGFERETHNEGIQSSWVVYGFSCICLLVGFVVLILVVSKLLYSGRRRWRK